MKDSGKMVTVGVAGLLLYVGSWAASLALHAHFWTRRTISQDVPWYYLGGTFLEGACAVIALPLLLLLGLLTKRKLGVRGWPMLLFPFFQFTTQVGQGIAVLLFTRRLWAGPSEASTSITTFEQYLHIKSVAYWVTMACVFIPAIFILRKIKANADGAPKETSE